MSGEPKRPKDDDEGLTEDQKFLSRLSRGVYDAEILADKSARAAAPAGYLADCTKSAFLAKLLEETEPHWFGLRCGDILGPAWRGKINGTVKGLTLLHYAAGAGNVELVKFLLANGADPKKADKEGNLPAPDPGNETPEANEIRTLLDEARQKGGRRKKTRSRKSRRRRTLRRKQ